MEQLVCARCKKTPEQLEEYVIEAKAAKITPAQFCWEEEGTLDRSSGYFLCTNCYVAVGMPSNRYPAPNWTATPQNLKMVGINV